MAKSKRNFDPSVRPSFDDLPEKYIEQAYINLAEWIYDGNVDAVVSVLKRTGGTSLSTKWNELEHEQVEQFISDNPTWQEDQAEQNKMDSRYSED